MGGCSGVGCRWFSIVVLKHREVAEFGCQLACKLAHLLLSFLADNRHRHWDVSPDWTPSCIMMMHHWQADRMQLGILHEICGNRQLRNGRLTCSNETS